MKINVRVVYLQDMLVYRAIFNAICEGVDMYWFTYVPDNCVVSENGQHKLTDECMAVILHFAEINIEISTAIKLREEESETV